MAWFQTSKQTQFLADKMRRCILSGAPIIEIPPAQAALLDFWRAQTRGEFNGEEWTIEKLEEYAASRGITPDMPELPAIWEHYTDARGNDILYKGWFIAVTLYALNGQPWWLLKATRGKNPTETADAALDRFVEMCKADPERDHIITIPGDEEDPTCQVFFSWFNQEPLLELHFRQGDFSKKKVKPGEIMRVCLEGTPPEPGWEAMPRHTMKDVEEIWAERDAKAQALRVNLMGSTYKP